MKPMRKPLSPSKRLEIAETLHISMLAGMFSIPNWKSHDIAFQGGTSLHLIWQSPRYSEDLDFLLRRDFDPDLLLRTLERATKEADRQMLVEMPGGKVNLEDHRKPERKLDFFELKWSHPDYFEKVVVKIEFWPVENNLLLDYPFALKNLSLPFQRIRAAMATVIPSAEIESLLGDKIVALALRPRTKWRDLYDLWWLEQHYGKTDPTRMLEAARRSLVMYESGEDELKNGLEKIIATSVEVIAAAAEKQLAPWLPPAVWNSLKGDGVRAIVASVQSQAKSVRNQLAWTLRP